MSLWLVGESSSLPPLSLSPLSLSQARAEEEEERVRRITEDKKKDMHEELVRKAAVKQVSGEEQHLLYTVNCPPPLSPPLSLFLSVH